MSNVIQLQFPPRQRSEAARQSALLANFALFRREDTDVFWLKEVAECLNILQATGAQLAPQGLEIFETFYAEMDRKAAFFPQYYRFFLSIAADLEDLGMPGDKARALAEFFDRSGVVEAELSDLQRAEARRLMARRGVVPAGVDAGLTERLMRFISTAQTFALPNKKAAYELTHIVFYLSEYGQRDPQLTEGARRSLNFAGTLAYLERNMDLLAEVALAMRFAGMEVPALWDSFILREAGTLRMIADEEAGLSDAYHPYLIANWYAAATGRNAFADTIPEGRVTFQMAHAQGPALRELSEVLFSAPKRSGDWGQMRDYVAGQLSDEAQIAVTEAEAASADFGAFFAGFARVGGIG